MFLEPLKEERARVHFAREKICEYKISVCSEREGIFYSYYCSGVINKASFMFLYNTQKLKFYVWFVSEAIF